MHRFIEGRRAVRRAGAVVCAASLTATLATTLLPGRDRAARAEGAPPGRLDARAAAAPREREVAPAGATATRPEGDARSAVEEAGSTAPGPPAAERLWSASSPRVFAYPPLAAAGPAQVVMILHGMCGDALRACERFREAGRDGAFLICPAGNVKCGGNDDWQGTNAQKATVLDGAMTAVDRAFGDRIDRAAGDVLIGFSRGAYVARDVVYERPDRFRGLLLIGASITPDPARLKASGIRRVVMAAGEYDGARPVMQRAAQALDRAGLPSRFVGIGRVGHGLPDDVGATLRDALLWLRDVERAPGATAAR